MKYNSTLVQDGKTLDVIVEANNIKEAKILTKQQYKNSRIIGAEQIINLHEVRNNSTSSGSGAPDVEGTVWLIGLIGLVWAFFTFTPWILMGLGGAAGTWIGEKVTGQSIEEYNESSDDDSTHTKAAIVFVLALLLGGIGFVKGDQIKKSFDAPNTPTQTQQVKK